MQTRLVICTWLQVTNDGFRGHLFLVRGKNKKIIIQA